MSTGIRVLRLLTDWVLGAPSQGLRIEPPDPELNVGASRAFAEGRFADAAQEYIQTLEFVDVPSVRNSAAYCLLLVGRVEEALHHLRHAASTDRKPLWEHNLGVAEYLDGSRIDGVRRIRDALSLAESEPVAVSVSSMLLIDCASNRVISEDRIPFDVAAMLNLIALGAVSHDDVWQTLTSRYPSARLDGLARRMQIASARTP